MATLNLFKKVHFISLLFLINRWSIPLVVRNLILIPNFIFLIFQSFSCEDRDKLARFRCKERKSLLITIITKK
jgi:hypothetical protein